MQTIAHLLRYFEDMPTYIVGRDCEDTPALPHLSVSISRAVQTQQLHVQTWKRQIERIIISSFLETSSYNNLYFIRSNSEIMFFKEKNTRFYCLCLSPVHKHTCTNNEFRIQAHLCLRKIKQSSRNSLASILLLWVSCISAVAPACNNVQNFLPIKNRPREELAGNCVNAMALMMHWFLFICVSYNPPSPPIKSDSCRKQIKPIFKFHWNWNLVLKEGEMNKIISSYKRQDTDRV